MDKKALKILLDRYWSSSGWKSDRYISKDDFEYAKSKGLMFDRLTISHDTLINNIKELYHKINKQLITNAFLAGLSKRRCDWRSALVSFAVVRVISEHQFSPNHPIQPKCLVCGEYLDLVRQDLNILNFERIKWGGVRHLQLIYFVGV